MHRFVLFLVGLVVLAIACGGGTADEESPGGNDSTGNPIRDALVDNLATGLLRDIPLLEVAEANCISEAILATLPDFGSALEDPDSFAQEILAETRAAQEHCLTPDRIAELEAAGTVVLTREPAVDAFLLLVRLSGGGLEGEDRELVDAGYLMCALAEEAGSLDELLARLTATPEASAKLAADLLPLLGKLLRDEELATFATTAVVSFCPEISELPSPANQP